MRSILGLCLAAVVLLADAHIFVYHRFGDARHPSTNTAIITLKRQFDYFKDHGYEVVPLSQLVTALRHHEKISDRWVVLTIDDSFKSFFDKGLPLFKAYGYPFTLFVYTQATQKRYGDYMSWDQIKEAACYGEIGFHSHTHPHMVSSSDTVLREDFEKGLALMQKHLGDRPRYFAYPYGEYDQRVQTIAKTFGFEAICNQNVGAVSAKSDPYDLDRIALTGNPSLAPKLALRFLPALWHTPKAWPKDGVLHQLSITLPTVANAKGWLYLTGYGWQKIKVQDHRIDLRIEKPLKNRRSRLILKLDHDRINTKILVKP